MNTLAQDLRYGFRLLWKSPSFTFVAVISIALGIGATTVIFSAVYGVLLRPLQYSEPEKLVAVWGALPKDGLDKNWISEPEFHDFQRDLHSFSGIAAYSSGNGANLSMGSSEPVRVTAGQSSANLFSVLGISPEMGRGFAPDEDRKGALDVVLLSHSLWKSRFASDPKIVGQTITLDGRGFAVIGVLPAGFRFGGNMDVWVPYQFDSANEDRGSHFLQVVARMAPGVSITQAASELASEAAELTKRFPDNYSSGHFGLKLFALKADLVEEVRTPLLVLLAAVMCLLLIAAANVANLLLSRASQREKEVAVRAALGATRIRVLRQLMTEGVLLSLMGCAVGVLLAYWGIELLKTMSATIPRADEIQLNPQVLLFSVAISIVTGMLFALAPGIHLVRSSPQNSLKESGRSNTGGKLHQRARTGFAAAEIGLALMLLVGAGLLIRSFYRMLQVDTGFQTAHLLTFRISLSDPKYKADQRLAIYQRMLEELSQTPGVQSVNTISQLPLGGSYSSGSVIAEDATGADLPRIPHANLPYAESDYRIVSADYLRSMGIQLISGRYFSDADDERAAAVAVIDSDFAQRFWPGLNPLGRRIALEQVPDSKPPQPRWRTVVGVVGHVKNYALDQKGREQVYVPLKQRPNWASLEDMFVAVRTSSDPKALSSSIQQLVHRIDPHQPIYQVRTMDELLEESFSQRRFNLVLLGLFAGLALLMAAIGIYGVISYGVTQRTQEFGIRIALGARGADVQRLVLSQAGVVLGLGVVGGLCGSLLLSRALQSLLFGISPADPVTFIGVAFLLGCVAFAASYLPARRATKVDPMVALRYE
jgi:putative ABC transport system permease protein